MNGKYEKVLIRKGKPEQQWNTTINLLESLKSKTLKTTNAGKDVEQQELLFTAGRNAKWYNHLGGTLFFF